MHIGQQIIEMSANQVFFVELITKHAALFECFFRHSWNLELLVVFFLFLSPFSLVIRKIVPEVTNITVNLKLFLVNSDSVLKNLIEKFVKPFLGNQEDQEKEESDK